MFLLQATIGRQKFSPKRSRSFEGTKNSMWSPEREKKTQQGVGGTLPQRTPRGELVWKQLHASSEWSIDPLRWIKTVWEWFDDVSQPVIWRVAKDRAGKLHRHCSRWRSERRQLAEGRPEKRHHQSSGRWWKQRLFTEHGEDYGVTKGREAIPGSRRLGWMQEPNQALRGDGGIVSRQLGCGDYDLGSISASCVTVPTVLIEIS